MRTLSVILIFIHWCIGFTTSAQTKSLAFVVEGRDELSGIDIYSLVQDDNRVIWIATNNGLYSYDGFIFKQHKISSSSSSSYFHLRKYEDGTIAFHNLLGELFEIRDNQKIELRYKVPQDKLHAYNVVYPLGVHNIFKSDGVYITMNDSLHPISSDKVFMGFDVLLDEKVFLHRRGSKLDIIDKEGKLSHVSISDSQDEAILTLFNSSGNYSNFNYLINRPDRLDTNYVIKLSKDLNTSHVFTFDDRYNDLILKQFYVINDSTLWWASEIGGVYEFVASESRKSFELTRVLFKNRRVSALTIDHENTIWLGTLGAGIIKIPSFHVSYLSSASFNDEVITNITKYKDGSLFLGSDKGSLFHATVNGIKTVGKINDRIICTVPLDNKSLLVNNKILPDNRSVIGLGSVKDAVEWRDGYLLATNMGLPFIKVNSDSVYVSGSIKEFYPQAVTDQFGIVRLMDERISALAYDKQKDILWIAAVSGLYRMSNKNLVKCHGELASSNIIGIEIVNGTCYAASPSKGLLRVDETSNVTYDNSQPNDWKEQGISKFSSSGDTLLVSSGNAIYLYLTSKGKIWQLPNSLSYRSGRMIDFALSRGQLWVSYIDGVRVFELDEIEPNEIAPIIRVDSLKVNGKLTSIQDLGLLSYDQNSLEVSFSTISLKNQEGIRYKYRLNGIDNAWRELNYANNKLLLPDLSPGKFTIEVVAINSDGISSDVLRIPVSIDAPYWQKTWFYAVLVVGVIIVVVLIAFLRLRFIRSKLELDKKLKSSEVTAIKAQMNPHFMFNALNSVQDLIHLDDKRNSSIYLSKVATLMRKTLDNSNKDTVSLHEEIELLTLYLDLEKLRFGNDLSIEVRNDVTEGEMMDIQIPPMIIQPYLENGFKHGLLHKSGEKKLYLAVSLNNSFLQVEVIDNGIGIEKSREINARRDREHKSFATSATQKRIDIINSMLQNKIEISIQDLMQGHTNPGTKVILKFPV